MIYKGDLPLCHLLLNRDQRSMYRPLAVFLSAQTAARSMTTAISQKKPWALLEYLVIFQKRDINPAELIRIIWADDPGVNPNGALKTLMFRSRKLLEPLGISPQKLLVQQRGTYAWTQDYPTVLDIDEFESVCNRALSNSLDPEENLSLCMEGLSIYKGDFLQNQNTNHGSFPSVLIITLCTRSWFTRPFSCFWTNRLTDRSLPGFQTRTGNTSIQSGYLQIKPWNRLSLQK